MTSISSSAANGMNWFQQRMFSEIDTTGSGSITKTSLEQAVTKAGGTTASADALYAQLDPNNSGSVDEQQFAQNLPAPPLSPQMGQQMMGYQANGWPGASRSDSQDQVAQSLFSQIDTTGSGSITQASLEKAVSAAGGTKAAADALYAQLDPNNTGSINEQQFAQALSKGGGHRHHHGEGGGGQGGAVGALAALLNTSNSSGTTTTDSTQDQIAQGLFSQIDTTGSGTITKSSLEQAVSAAGGSTADADALYAKLDPNNTGSVTEQQFAQVLTQPYAGSQTSRPGSGNAAPDALAALASASGAVGSGDSPRQVAQTIFGDIDTSGSGSITPSSLEQAVTAAGGSSSAADALFAQLDPNNTGSVSEQQFVDALQPKSLQGNTPQDALLALLHGTSQTAADTGAVRGSGISDDAASPAFEDLMAELSNPSSTTGSGSGTGAQDALAALLQTGQNNGWTSSGPSPFDFESAIAQYQQDWASMGAGS